jgi:DNA-binding CsgD family transcriptional regulator
MGDRDYARLVATAYEAALSPELWRGFAEDLTRTFDGTAFNLSVFAPSAGAGALAVAWGLPEEHVRSYREYWRHDVWRTGSLRHGVIGHVVAGEAMVPEAELLKSVVYNEVLRRGDYRHICGGLIFCRPEDGTGAGFSIMRTGRQGAFSPREVRAANRLLPHVGRALGLWARLASAEARAGALFGAFEAAGTAVVLLDAGGGAVEMNAQAERLFRAGDALVLRAGRVAARASAADRTLQRLLRRAPDPSASAAETADVAIARPAPRPPLRVRALPLRERCHPLAPVLPALLVLIEDPAARVQAPAERVARRYGLTAAESALFAALVGGVSVAEFAERRGISVHTARNQLKSVFQKTGARRQTELLRLVFARDEDDSSDT